MKPNGSIQVNTESADKITIIDAAGDTAIYKLTSGAGTKSGTFKRESGETLAEGSTYTATYDAVEKNGDRHYLPSAEPALTYTRKPSSLSD